VRHLESDSVDQFSTSTLR